MLVATSIAEEGLDIGEVDLIVLYDSVQSPIRFVQRIGRTGRKRNGRVVMILVDGKDEDKVEKSDEASKKLFSELKKAGAFKLYKHNPAMLPTDYPPPTLCEVQMECTDDFHMSRVGGVGTAQGQSYTSILHKENSSGKNSSLPVTSASLQTNTMKSYFQSMGSANRNRSIHGTYMGSPKVQESWGEELSKPAQIAIKGGQGYEQGKEITDEDCFNFASLMPPPRGLERYSQPTFPLPSMRSTSSTLTLEARSNGGNALGTLYPGGSEDIAHRKHPMHPMQSDNIYNSSYAQLVKDSNSSSHSRDALNQSQSPAHRTHILHKHVLSTPSEGSLAAPIVLTDDDYNDDDGSIDGQAVDGAHRSACAHVAERSYGTEINAWDRRVRGQCGETSSVSVGQCGETSSVSGSSVGESVNLPVGCTLIQSQGMQPGTTYAASNCDKETEDSDTKRFENYSNLKHLGQPLSQQLPLNELNELNSMQNSIQNRILRCYSRYFESPAYRDLIQRARASSDIYASHASGGMSANSCISDSSTTSVSNKSSQQCSLTRSPFFPPASLGHRVPAVQQQLQQKQQQKQQPLFHSLRAVIARYNAQSTVADVATTSTTPSSTSSSTTSTTTTATVTTASSTTATTSSTPLSLTATNVAIVADEKRQHGQATMKMAYAAHSADETMDNTTDEVAWRKGISSEIYAPPSCCRLEDIGSVHETQETVDVKSQETVDVKSQETVNVKSQETVDVKTQETVDVKSIISSTTMFPFPPSTTHAPSEYTSKSFIVASSLADTIELKSSSSRAIVHTDGSTSSSRAIVHTDGSTSSSRAIVHTDGSTSSAEDSYGEMEVRSQAQVLLDSVSISSCAALVSVQPTQSRAKSQSEVGQNHAHSVDVLTAAPTPSPLAVVLAGTAARLTGENRGEADSSYSKSLKPSVRTSATSLVIHLPVAHLLKPIESNRPFTLPADDDDDDDDEDDDDDSNGDHDNDNVSIQSDTTVIDDSGFDNSQQQQQQQFVPKYTSGACANERVFDDARGNNINHGDNTNQIKRSSNESFEKNKNVGGIQAVEKNLVEIVLDPTVTHIQTHLVSKAAPRILTMDDGKTKQKIKFPQKIITYYLNRVIITNSRFLC